jgi:LPS sulfotransferase NodH
MIIDESYSGENLVFLIGCPRSGTTWLQRMLAAHPGIATGQETHLFDFYIGPQLRIWRKLLDPSVTGRGRVGIGCYLAEEEFLDVVRDYMRALLAGILGPVGSGTLFLEKTPAHALHVSEIHQLLPRARFIHLVRDPRDVVASLLAASRSWGAGWAPQTASRAAVTWRRHVEAARESAASLPTTHFMEVRYEALLADTATALSGIARFLEVEWSGAALQAAIEVNRASEARQGGGTPIPLGRGSTLRGSVVEEPDGFVRRATSGGWKHDLSWREKAAVRTVTWRLMSELGYARRPGRIARALMSAAWSGRSALLARLA